MAETNESELLIFNQMGHGPGGKVYRDFYMDGAGYGIIESAGSISLENYFTGEQIGSVDQAMVNFTDLDSRQGLRLEPGVRTLDYIGDNGIAARMVKQAYDDVMEYEYRKSRY